MKNQQILSFIREIVVVLVGVLIALFINNWREQINNQNYINKTIRAINEEINLSRTEVKEVMEKHIKRIEAINANLDNESLSIRNILEQSGGIQIPEIKNISLRFFISNKAELVDYYLISDLSEIEFASKGFEKKMEILLEYVYENMENTDKESKLKLVVYLTEVLEGENNLLELYESFLEKYQTSLNDSSKVQ